MKGNGLDDKRIKYYPFRDDAKLILKVFEEFINDLLDSYYVRKGPISIYVKHDKELQAMANEISLHGNKLPDGGKGRVKIIFFFMNSKFQN